MREVIIRPCTVAELEQSDSFALLLDAYAKESNIPELGEVSARMDIYRAMEAAGSMHVIGVFADCLIGLATIIVYGLPHYGGKMIAVTESLFVDPGHRAGGTGSKLLRYAEQYAKELGAVAFMVSAPVGGRLADVLPRSGYRETNRVFIRSLA